MSLARGDFAAFFASVRDGQSPFAWQERLLDHLLEQERWPERVVAPTGAGKTAVIDVHVFANALLGAGAGPRVPRRLAVVVDRRVVVDSHDEHARHLAELLEGTVRTGEGVLGEVGLSLRALQVPAVGARRPLATVRLRGGSPPPRSWRDETDGCLVLACTPDMWGSRLLLQGYGSPRLARPREAGLLAVDAAVVVDEAHLARQLVRTARRVAELQRSAGAVVGVPVLQVVETTATPDAAERASSEVGVDSVDLESSETLRARMRRPKPLELVTLDSWPVPDKGSGRTRAIAAIADEAEELVSRQLPTVGCVLNTVALAVDVAAELRRRGRRTALLVGRLRPADLDAIRAEHPGLLDLRGNDGVEVLVATQTVEVGIDLDLSGLVTELAPGTALAQRCGRVNRAGRRDVGPVSVVCGAQTVVDGKSGPYAAADLTDARAWATRREADPAGIAPWSVLSDPPPQQGVDRPAFGRVEVADSWQWARTSQPQFAVPDLDLWLADELEVDSDVGLVIRRLPLDTASAIEQLRCLPPRDHEVFTVGIKLARDVVEPLLVPVGAADPRSPILRFRAGEVTELTEDAVIRPADVVVMPEARVAGRGGLPDPQGTEPLRDVLETGLRRGGTGRGRRVQARADLRLGAGSLLDPTRAGETSALAEAITTAIATGSEPVTFARRAQRSEFSAALRRVAACLTAAELTEAVNATAALLDERLERADLVVQGDPAQPVGLLVVDNRRAIADEDLRETWSTASEPVTLADHQRDVGERAVAVGSRLGITPDLVDILGQAGFHHDDGKVDPRFQAMLASTDGVFSAEESPATEWAGVALAKSRPRSAAVEQRVRASSPVPRGWRHEQLSALRVWVAHADREGLTRALLTRLVGTTHGHGRPLFPHSGAGLLLAGDQDAAAASELFDVGSWDELVERTDSAFGVWGTAYLEALLRGADGVVSRDGGAPTTSEQPAAEGRGQR